METMRLRAIQLPGNAGEFVRNYGWQRCNE
jgi:hypothetical protein